MTADRITLGQAAKEQVYLISCSICKHKTQVDLAAMVAKLGESFPLDNLRPRLKCSKCGSKKTISTTLWLSSTATEGFVRRFFS